MKIAKGTTSWVLIPIPIIILSLIGTMLLTKQIQSIAMFILTISLLLECFFLMFFRDPERNIGTGIVAVADGKIQNIEEIQDKDVGKSILISTFMNVQNVHVNRMPIEGEILSVTHIPGGYLPAFKKESERNERVVTLVQTTFGKIKIIQIAGTLAKRIVVYGKKGQQLSKGQRFGMIKLGSRVDIILPKTCKNNITITIGDRVLAGEDTICDNP